jgi:hypothetical protein
VDALDPTVAPSTVSERKHNTKENSVYWSTFLLPDKRVPLYVEVWPSGKDIISVKLWPKLVCWSLLISWK